MKRVGGVRGRVAGRATVGSGQKPHTEKSRMQYAAWGETMWAAIRAKQARKEEDQ